MSDPQDGAGQEVALRDEVLELLYWLEGEGFGSRATLDGLLQFIAFPVEEVRGVLQGLLSRGDIVNDEHGVFRLTELGRLEAARRFADDFAELMHRGHGECSDPACDCHKSPGGAADCLARQHESHRH